MLKRNSLALAMPILFYFSLNELFLIYRVAKVLNKIMLVFMLVCCLNSFFRIFSYRDKVARKNYLPHIFMANITWKA